MRELERVTLLHQHLQSLNLRVDGTWRAAASPSLALPCIVPSRFPSWNPRDFSEQIFTPPSFAINLLIPDLFPYSAILDFIACFRGHSIMYVHLFYALRQLYRMVHFNRSPCVLSYCYLYPSCSPNLNKKFSHMEWTICESLM